MADITLFELHLHDGLDFSPSPRFGGDADPTTDGSESTDDTDYDGDDEQGAGRGALVALVGVVLAVALAVGARKLLSDDLEPLEELDDLAEE
ncbi:hypothetical protein Hbl1158_08175 [Halobaculum sp. CBA1158]|uniref:hypothetical protein n=1 Tax=Halobaculum sp. CBA1158 TaxID=2904243 RepID=UPI001F3F1982|nr:hypothetical protein [Halobaculum sp. CBA1158]UIO98538.1 hypothetical protein Hbl1158_08175 [Halobaculum sp. CBA1158]